MLKPTYAKTAARIYIRISTENTRKELLNLMHRFLKTSLAKHNLDAIW